MNRSIVFILILAFVCGEDKVEESTTTYEDTTTLRYQEDDELDNVNIEEITGNIFKFPDSTKTTTTTESSVNKEADVNSNNVELSNIQKILEERSKDKFCGCDLTTGACNVNCCCDLDCTEQHFKAFSRCTDQGVDKDRDNWYCKEKPFFRRNDTRFILEKIVDSLFCIASDNLPPVYSATSHLHIEDEKSFKNVIDKNKPSRFKWNLDTKKIVLHEFNVSNLYRHGDMLWKIRKSTLQPLELPQTGFGKACDFKKTVTFLEDWKSSCHQYNLNNKNMFLFPSNFTNFTVVALPSKFSSQYLDQACPKDVCRYINVSLCSESLKLCKPTNKTVQGYCSDNVCYNAVKNVKYIIHHDGSNGIKNVEVLFHLANVSTSFKQEIQVSFKWVDLNESLIFERSGNPGYVSGKPIFVGTQMSNKSGDAEIKYIQFNKTYQHITLPVADKSGMCSGTERYPVRFLEDVKLKCSIRVETFNFSTSTCIKLQNRTFESIVNFMALKSFEKINFDRQYVSKSGDVFDNVTESWAKIFFEKIPQNVITSQVIENELQCSGLVTSVSFDIVHSLISKLGTNRNHVILGVGVQFSQEVDLKWSKCVGKNCQDVLQLDLISYVSFHDVSRPTRYHIAGGPNLDISLPYDFFYPFLSHSKSMAPLLSNNFIYIVAFITLNLAI